MSVKYEIAELMRQDGRMYEWAEHVQYHRTLTTEEKDINAVVDAWAKEIGKTGHDRDHELAAFIVQTITPSVLDGYDELIDTILDRDTIGEFDDFSVDVLPKNTLEAQDAAKGGNVDKTYIDPEAVKPVWKNKQIDTEVSFSDLRRNGFKSIANLTTYAKEALHNAMIADIFGHVDATITAPDQRITSTGGLTMEAMDALALYVIDHLDSGQNGISLSLNKYAQAIAKMAGYDSYLSDNMKDEFNRYGLVKLYQGVAVAGISGAKKVANKSLLLPDKKIFGVAGKVGSLNMRGDVHVYESADNNRERITLKIADFNYGFAVHTPEKICVITCGR